MKKIYRWRKTTDVNREFALFELLDGETPLLDVGLSDEGSLEIAFNPSIGGTILKYESLMQLLDEARALVKQDQ
jgi:hypothetical protein